MGEGTGKFKIFKLCSNQGVRVGKRNHIIPDMYLSNSEAHRCFCVVDDNWKLSSLVFTIDIFVKTSSCKHNEARRYLL